jgi:phosphotriesterase-related protein
VPSVQTAKGEVELRDLGRTLMHEHVFAITAEVAHDYPDLSWTIDKAGVIDSVVEKLIATKNSGIDTIVDLTAFGHGRAIWELQEVASRIELNIVVATGFYTSDHLSYFFEFRQPDTESKRVDIMTEMCIRDIKVGVGGTGIKAGVIKCATDRQGVTANIERILRATAQAHRETGAPISTHTDSSTKSGLDQQRIFASEGVDLSRVVIGHSGDSTDLDYLRQLMDQGSVIGCDRFGLYLPEHGLPGMDTRIDTIARLCELGYSDRIVLAHDATCFTDWFPSDGGMQLPTWVHTHISNAVVPAMLELGISQRDVDAMLIDNPRRILENLGRY